MGYTAGKFQLFGHTALHGFIELVQPVVYRQRQSCDLYCAQSSAQHRVTQRYCCRTSIVRLSFTRWCCVETAWHVVKLSAPRGTILLQFPKPNCFAESKYGHPNGTVEYKFTTRKPLLHNDSKPASEILWLNSTSVGTKFQGVKN